MRQKGKQRRENTRNKRLVKEQARLAKRNSAQTQPSKPTHSPFDFANPADRTSDSLPYAEPKKQNRDSIILGRAKPFKPITRTIEDVLDEDRVERIPRFLPTGQVDLGYVRSHPANLDNKMGAPLKIVPMKRSSPHVDSEAVDTKKEPFESKGKPDFGKTLYSSTPIERTKMSKIQLEPNSISREGRVKLDTDKILKIIPGEETYLSKILDLKSKFAALVDPNGLNFSRSRNKQTVPESRNYTLKNHWKSGSLKAAITKFIPFERTRKEWEMPLTEENRKEDGKIVQFLSKYKKIAMSAAAALAIATPLSLLYVTQPAERELDFTLGKTLIADSSTLEHNLILSNGTFGGNKYTIANSSSTFLYGTKTPMRIEAFDTKTNGVDAIDFSKTTTSNITNGSFSPDITLDKLVIRVDEGKTLLGTITRSQTGEYILEKSDDYEFERFDTEKIVERANKFAVYLQGHQILRNSVEEAMFLNDSAELEAAQAGLSFYRDYVGNRYASTEFLAKINSEGYDYVVTLNNVMKGLRTLTSKTQIASTKPLVEEKTLPSIKDAYSSVEGQTPELVLPTAVASTTPVAKTGADALAAIVKDNSSVEGQTPELVIPTAVASTTPLVNGPFTPYVPKDLTILSPEVTEKPTLTTAPLTITVSYDDFRVAAFKKAGKNTNEFVDAASNIVNKFGYKLKQLTDNPLQTITLSSTDSQFGSLAALMGRDIGTIASSDATAPNEANVTEKPRSVENIWVFAGKNNDAYSVHHSGNDSIATRNEVVREGHKTVGKNRSDFTNAMYRNETSAMGISAKALDRLIVSKAPTADVSTILDDIAKKGHDVYVANYTVNKETGDQDFKLTANSTYAKLRYLQDKVTELGEGNVLVDEKIVYLKDIQKQLASISPPKPVARTISKAHAMKNDMALPSGQKRWNLPTTAQVAETAEIMESLLPDKTHQLQRYAIAQFEQNLPIDYVKSPGRTEYSQLQSGDALDRVLGVKNDVAQFHLAAHRVGIPIDKKSDRGKRLIPTHNQWANKQYGKSWDSLVADARDAFEITDYEIRALEGKLPAGAVIVDSGSKYDGDSTPVYGDYDVSKTRVLSLLDKGIEAYYGEFASTEQKDYYAKNCFEVDGNPFETYAAVVKAFPQKSQPLVQASQTQIPLFDMYKPAPLQQFPIVPFSLNPLAGVFLPVSELELAKDNNYVGKTQSN